MYIDIAKHADKDRVLPSFRGLEPVAHRFERESLHALNTALAACRPLLIRGEPGTGKSQLARAAADLLGRGFIWRVVNAQTRVKDLFYEFDAVARLAEAQIAGHREPDELSKLLDERRFIIPGPLWWAFASKRARSWLEKYRPGESCDEPLTDAEVAKGVVVLLDEIDKTDPSVPNGLLEAVGQGTFPVPKESPVSLHRERSKPLIVFTTNEERELPSAFLRRCLVLHILVPKERSELVEWLIERGQTHFVDRRAPAINEPGEHYEGETLSEDLLGEAADQVYEDRVTADNEGLSRPGQAEYLDLLRALARLKPTNDERMDLLAEIRNFALAKHPQIYEKHAKQSRDRGRSDEHGKAAQDDARRSR